MNQVDRRIFKSRVYQIAKTWVRSPNDKKTTDKQIEWERECMDWMATKLYEEFLICARPPQKEE